MKTIHIFFIVVVLCLLGFGAAAAVAYSKHSKDNDKDPAPGATGSGSTGSGAAAKSLNQSKSLGIGSKGAEVKELQRLFNAGGGQPALVEDGVFGAKTLGAVIKVMGFGTSSTTLSAFVPAMAAYKNKLEGKVLSESNTSFLKKLLNL